MKTQVHASENEIPFRSELEQVCWDTWLPTIDHLSAYYEPITLRTSGGKYTPDFLMVMPNLTMVYVEVKGSWKARGGPTSRRRLREAAATFGWMANFIAVLPEKERQENKKKVVDNWIVEKYGTWGGDDYFV